jgi:hypothetical protein
MAKKDIPDPKRVLDWRPHFDERSRKYSVRSLLGTQEIKKQSKFWQEGTVLNQGSEGACVGFGWMAEVIAEPVQPDEQPSEQLGNQLARYYYKEAQKIDEWPGEDYEGTSVLAGAKIMKQHGLITEYRWCFSIDDIIDVVISKGPVVIGVPWYSTMYYTNNFDMVVVGGKKVGGHCLVITGYDPEKKVGRQTFEVFKWRNSWGKEYGENGSGYIKVSDLRKLFEEGGEACVPIIRHRPVLAYPPRALSKQAIFIKNIFWWIKKFFN